MSKVIISKKGRRNAFEGWIYLAQNKVSRLLIRETAMEFGFRKG